MLLEIYLLFCWGFFFSILTMSSNFLSFDLKTTLAFAMISWSNSSVQSNSLNYLLSFPASTFCPRGYLVLRKFDKVLEYFWILVKRTLACLMECFWMVNFNDSNRIDSIDWAMQILPCLMLISMRLTDISFWWIISVKSVRMTISKLLISYLLTSLSSMVKLMP